MYSAILRLYFVVQCITFTSLSFPLLAFTSQCHLQTPSSTETPVQPHLSVCPSPKQTRRGSEIRAGVYRKRAYQEKKVISIIIDNYQNIHIIFKRGRGHFMPFFSKLFLIEYTQQKNIPLIYLFIHIFPQLKVRNKRKSN